MKKEMTDDEIRSDPKFLDGVDVGSHPFLLFFDDNDFAIIFTTADDLEKQIRIPKQALASLGRAATRLGERFTK